jgi:hypothetical protein
MSVNLHLSVRVSGYDPGRIAAIRDAVQTIFEREQIANVMSPLGEVPEGPGRVLLSRSNPEYPVIISSSYKWIPEVQTALAEAVLKANGGPCAVQFDGDDADEGEEDEPEEAEDDE